MSFLILQYKQGVINLPPTLLNTYPQTVDANGIHGIAMRTDGKIWLSIAYSQDDLRLFDPSTGTIVDSIDNVGLNPRGMVMDSSDNLWVAINAGAVFNKYSSTNTLLRQISVFNAQDVVLGGNGWVWGNAETASGNFYGFDPASSSSTADRSFTVGSFSKAILADSNGNVWGSGSSYGNYTFYNFATDTATLRTDIDSSERIISFAEGNDGYVYAFGEESGTEFVKQMSMSNGALIQEVYFNSPSVSYPDRGKLLTDADGYIWNSSRRFSTTTFTYDTPITGVPLPQSQLVGGRGTVQSPITGYVYTVNNGDANVYEIG